MGVDELHRILLSPVGMGIFLKLNFLVILPEINAGVIKIETIVKKYTKGVQI